MITINVKENESIERALKRFKKKFERTQTLRRLRARQQFVKPSVTRRKEIIKARYRQDLRNQGLID